MTSTAFTPSKSPVVPAKTLIYLASDQLLSQEFITTGRMGERIRTVTVPMDMAEVRTAWVALFGLSDVGDAVESSYSKGQPRLFHSLGRNHAADHVLSPDEATALIVTWAKEATAKEKERVQAKNLREADKALWIEQCGSDHLKQIFAEGFHAQNTYVAERLEDEAGDFYELDFYNTARVNPRTDPSPAAMKLLAQARALGVGEPQIGWQVKPIDPKQADFVQGEVIYVSNYLWKYTLIRKV